MVISHARGLAGTPSRGHCSSAARKASCSASSATSKSPSCRHWRGWTTPENADAYEDVVRNQVIPEIEARHIPGFLRIDLMKPNVGDEVEFATLMWFERLKRSAAPGVA